MADRFYVYADGHREGPYSQEELRRMLEDEVLSFKDYCIREGAQRRQRLDALFEVVPESEAEADLDDGEEEWEEEWEYEDAEEEDDEADDEVGHPTRFDRS